MPVEFSNIKPPEAVELQLDKKEEVLLQKNEKLAANEVNTLNDISENTDSSADSFAGKSKNLNIGFKNANEGFNTVIIADLALDEIKDNLTQLKDIAIASNNTLTTVEDRKDIQTQFESLLGNLNSNVQKNDYNGKSILNLLNNGGIDFRINNGDNGTVNLAFQNEGENNEFNAAGLNIENVKIEEQEDIEKAIYQIDNAIAFIDEKKEEINIAQEDLSLAMSNLAINDSNFNNIGRIDDNKAAESAVQLLTNRILENEDEASYSQANSRYESYLNLLKTSLDFAEEPAE